MTRSHNPRWRRARGLAALAVPLALAASVLPASGTALAQPAPTSASTPTPATTPAATGLAGLTDQHQARPLTLPGLHDDSYSVTLLTGDQIRLTAAGVGRYMVVATPNTGSRTVTVDATSRPDGVTTLQATPSAAQFLLASGQVDKGLFDLGYLAAHGYTDGAGRPIPVTVQYTDHPTADTMTRRAGSLPTSTVAATDTQAGTADLRVDPQHLGDFWAALTDATTTGEPPSGLANGIAHVWLTGHRTSDPQAVRPDTGEPTYPVTVSLTLKPGDLGGAQTYMCNGAISAACPVRIIYMPLTGDDAGHSNVAPLTCVDQDPCTTRRARFDAPAGSYVIETDLFSFYIDAHLQFGRVVEPQVEVNGPTDITYDLSRMQRIDITTPKPSETFNSALQWQRTLPDGSSFVSLAFELVSGGQSDWALPTDQPVTLGTFHFSTLRALGKPPVTARVDSPQHVDLHPIYPLYNTGNDTIVRFDGRQRLQVVDAGYGRPEDFAAIDAHGKLALMRLGDGDTKGCSSIGLGGTDISKAQLDNAIKAGAAGVLIDPRSPNMGPGSWCRLPITYEDSTTPPDMPFAAINISDATRLESLLGHGDVRVTITDSGVSPYIYNLKLNEEGGIPDSLHYDIDDDQLAVIDDRLHADTLTAPEEHSLGIHRPDEGLIAGLADLLAWPARRTEYDGPISPETVFVRQWQASGTTRDVFDHRGSSRIEDINARPLSPGPVTYDAEVPAKFEQGCAMCRQGNALSPRFNLGRGNVSDISVVDPSTTHLYLGDKEIPQTSIPPGYPAYMLPAERHGYRLVTDYDNTEYGHTHVDWTFSSAAPEHDEEPPGIGCRGEVGKPCQAQPLVFLTYDMDVDLHNTITAPGVPQFTVTASHQAADAPAIRDLKLWTSTDDGEHWTPALLLPHGRGEHGARTFSVITGVPWLSQTTGTLSIKAQATDAEGNSITETLTQAVKLTQRSGWAWPGHRMWQ